MKTESYISTIARAIALSFSISAMWIGFIGTYLMPLSDILPWMSRTDRLEDRVRIVFDGAELGAIKNELAMEKRRNSALIEQIEGSSARYRSLADELLRYRSLSDRMEEEIRVLRSVRLPADMHEVYKKRYSNVALRYNEFLDLYDSTVFIAPVAYARLCTLRIIYLNKNGAMSYRLVAAAAGVYYSFDGIVDWRLRVADWNSFREVCALDIEPSPVR